MKRSRIYKGMIGLLAAVCVFAMQCTIGQAAVQPFRLEISELDKETGRFDVTVRVPEAYAFSAYDYAIEFSSDVLEIVTAEGAEAEGYAYTDDFKTAYANGLALCNKKGTSFIMFSGAKSGAEAFQGNMAVLHFKVKDTAKDSVTYLYLHTRTVGIETESGVQKQEISAPSIQYRVMIKEIPGDVNMDGDVKLNDAQLALKAALRIIKFDETQIRLADFDGNGSVDLKDAQTILKKALRIIP